jgi:hypothetical protein
MPDVNFAGLPDEVAYHPLMKMPFVLAAFVGILRDTRYCDNDRAMCRRACELGHVLHEEFVAAERERLAAKAGKKEAKA